MEMEVVPEPAPAERQAVEQALAELVPDHSDGSAWWRAGAREAVTPEEEPG